ncbi:MAG: 6-carboxytetrahydropterin synthase QueD [Candidatus Cloacimonadota bacterium]|nr:6-carboxytetrahydropterin synthase QueD [Candidatus Cloacimonadota bacterium]
MYIINVIEKFCGAHKLNGYEGECSNIHGHNWRVRLAIACKNLDSIGLSIDFKEAKRKLKNILDEFDHKNLNDLEAFYGKNPSSENIAKTIFNLCADVFDDDNSKVIELQVWESDNYSIIYLRDENN